MPQTSRFKLNPTRLHRSALALWLALLASPAWSASNTTTTQTPTAEFVYKYLLGEVAAQRGEFVLASQLFLDLAKQTHDPQLAERATQAATIARVPQLALPSAELWSDLVPDSIPAAQAASQLLIANGELKKAMPKIEKVLTDEHIRPNAFMELNSLMMRITDKKSVLQAIQQLAKPYPTLAEAHFAISQAAYFAHNEALMEKELKETSRLRPDWEAPAQIHGQMLTERDPQKGIAFYREFLKSHPDADQIRLALARSLLVQKNTADAKVEFTTLLEKHQDNPEMNVIVGLLALDAREYTFADRYLQHALDVGFKEPNKLYFNLGRSAAEQQDDARALQWFDRIGEGEQFLAGRLAAAAIIARRDGVDAAITMLDNINGLSDDQQILIIQNQALMLNQAKRAEEASALLGKGLQAYPDSPDLLYDYALNAERLGKFQVMEDALRKVIKLKPDFAAAYNALGYSYADRNINLTEAKSLIEMATRLSPEDHYIMDSLGWVYYRLGDMPHATEQLRRAYAIQQDPEIAAHLAEVLWKQGQHDEAQKILDQALSANPDNEVLASTAQKLKSSL
ncbi:Tetratricopeptide repeat-containing protein [Methylophilus rhizosphaerae]|uniref:Tetratricopeptide repeat-containing protein n=1 Tax=Methylophilus rhizosphaerae TaxID=492660 RepID=A0A1G9A4W7_9PROT|nr:tetratricopeptide repeat protein [Methylophilus rhizosphaerae]SDK22281.1 Tetratricopeptide repeat-containing protein [Methylophilus rhizosphaerae]